MPHVCMRCKNVFDGREDILQGCPVCGWKKFMFTRGRGPLAQDDAPGKEPLITAAMGVRVPPRARSQEAEGAEGEVVIVPGMVGEDGGAGAEDSRDTRDTRDTRELRDLQDPRDQPADGKVESIRITAPGTYELNLPTLFERDELVMAVKEGTYLIDLSSAFRKGKKE